MPEKSVGSVSARFSVWFSLVRRAANASRDRLEHLEAAGVERGERLAPRDEPHPRALLRARLGEEERPGVEVEGEETDLLWNGTAASPAFHRSRPAIMRWRTRKRSVLLRTTRTIGASRAGRPPRRRSALDVGQRRRHRPQDERAREPDLPQRLALQEAVEVLDVDGDIRKFGHSGQNRPHDRPLPESRDRRRIEPVLARRARDAAARRCSPRACGASATSRSSARRERPRLRGRRAAPRGARAGCRRVPRHRALRRRSPSSSARSACSLSRAARSSTRPSSSTAALVYEVARWGSCIAAIYHCRAGRRPASVPKGWSPVAVWHHRVPASRAVHAREDASSRRSRRRSWTRSGSSSGSRSGTARPRRAPSRSRMFLPTAIAAVIAIVGSRDRLPSCRRRPARREELGSYRLVALHRPRRHGRGLARRAPHARARRRDQARARRHRRRRGRETDGALRARGEGHGRRSARRTRSSSTTSGARTTARSTT